MNNQLIKLLDVKEKTSLSRSHIYALAQKGEFPNPIKLSARSSAWLATEVQDWIDSKIQARNLGGN